MTAVTEKISHINGESEVKEEEEVLGSVTHEAQSTERPIQLRTSARVSKKLRLDSQTNAAPPPVVEKKGNISIRAFLEYRLKLPFLQKPNLKKKSLSKNPVQFVEFTNYGRPKTKMLFSKHSTSTVKISMPYKHT